MISELLPRPNERDEWRTPPEIVAQVARIYGGIAMDVACRTSGNSVSNAVLQWGTAGESTEPLNRPRFWSGLEIHWSGGIHTVRRGAVWCNPPYSDIGPWVDKAMAEFETEFCPPIVMILPANTDTKWFHKLAAHPDVRLEFTAGRIKFLRPEGSPGDSPRTGSVFAHFQRRIKV